MAPKLRRTYKGKQGEAQPRSDQLLVIQFMPLHTGKLWNSYTKKYSHFSNEAESHFCLTRAPPLLPLTVTHSKFMFFRACFRGALKFKTKTKPKKERKFSNTPSKFCENSWEKNIYVWFMLWKQSLKLFLNLQLRKLTVNLELLLQIQQLSTKFTKQLYSFLTLCAAGYLVTLWTLGLCSLLRK